MTALTINGVSLAISPDRANYNDIRLKYQRLAEAAAEGFATNFAVTFKNMDDIHNNCTDVFIPMLREVAEIAVKDIVAKGIYDIDLELFSEYMVERVTWEEDFAGVDDKYMEIVLKAEELDAYRTQRRESRGRWVGGGFGVSGAVKGAMQAGAMNLATGAVHGLFNLTAKGISAVGDAMKKNELYSSVETRTTLIDAVYRSIFSVHFALIDAINDKLPGTITGYVSEDDEAKAMRLVQNVDAGRLPEASIQTVLLDALGLNPYNEGIYQLWLQKFGDASGELESVERLFGISVSGRAKQDLIEARKATLDFSSPEACDTSLAALAAYAQSINYRDFDKEKAAVLAIKEVHAQAKRTHAGTVYPTIEAAEQAKDAEARTVRGVTYDTHEKADDARAQKVVGIGFYLGLLLFPYITPFFTLRKGYSTKIRIISFGWLAGLIALYGIGEVIAPKPPAQVHVQATEAASNVAAAPATASPPSTSNAPPPVALPFVGKRSFNFDGGNGTEQSITITTDGQARVESYGSSGTIVNYEGAFTNPLRMANGQGLLFKGKAVFLTDGTNVQKGCKAEKLECAEELYDAAEQANAPLSLKTALADSRSITCRFNEAEQTCMDINGGDGRAYSPEDFVLSKGYTALLSKRTFDDPGTTATYLKLTVKP